MRRCKTLAVMEIENVLHPRLAPEKNATMQKGSPRKRPAASSSSSPSSARKGKATRSSARPALRNEDPTQIETYGFVECGQLIDTDLCAKIVKLKMHDAKDISNAVEKTLKGHLSEGVCTILTNLFDSTVELITITLPCNIKPIQFLL